MEITMIDKHQSLKRSSSLTIRPFVDNTNDNMGLEKYQMVLFEGVFHEEQIICLENNGIKRYITGLNEFAPEIKNMHPDERDATIKDIRNTVAQLERELADSRLKISELEAEKDINEMELKRNKNNQFHNGTKENMKPTHRMNNINTI